MGITTQYLRYVPGDVFGVVGTSRCIRFITKFSQKNKFVVVAACEKVIVWDLKRAAKLITFDGGSGGTVTTLEVKPPHPGSLDNTHIAVGYSNGSVVIYDMYQSQPLTFSGHKSSISTLAWNDTGLLASGSVDGEIVIWDVSSERGVVRFPGHKGIITRVRFLQKHNILVSSGKDMTIKFWDLDTNHCFKTLAEHTKEVWDFVILKEDALLITGSSDEYLRVWRMSFNSSTDETGPSLLDPPDQQPSKLIKLRDDDKTSTDITDDASGLKLESAGRIERTRNDRVSGLATDGKVLICHSKGKLVEAFAILSSEQVRHKIDKRMKRQRKRARDDGTIDSASISDKVQLIDEVRKLPPISTTSKLNSVDVVSGDSLSIAALHSNNSIAFYEGLTQENNENNKDNSHKVIPKMVVDGAGHRTEVRAVAFNSIGDQIISGSGDSIKVWDRSQCRAVMTLPSEYVVSLAVVPGDRHVLVGTMGGHILLYELGGGTLLEDMEAHQGDNTNTDTGVWGLTVTPDGRGFVSGGSDSVVHFFKFELVQGDQNEGRRLTFVQDKRALKVADQVTALKCSSSGKFLAVATLDLKETIYYMDTLKLANELYGKSLPATCMDFSADEHILAVGSKDTCIRIFGTDFGDQRRLLKNAHQGGVTDLQFISKTHLLFSAGHDGCVKQWDADNFQLINTLKGHHGIIRCLSIVPNGTWVVSCGQDYSLRMWERTQEPLILEEEREEERRRQDEESGVTATQRPVVDGEDIPDHAVRPSVSSHLTDQATDRIIEAINIYEEQVVLGTNAIPHQLMSLVYHTKDPHKFLVEVLRKVKSTELEEAILLLPFDYIIKLLKGSKNLLERKYDVELVGRIVVVALRVNMAQIIASTKAAEIVRQLSTILPDTSQELQDRVGFNLAGLNHMKYLAEQRSEIQLFAEATERVKSSKKKRRKKTNAAKTAALLIV